MVIKLILITIVFALSWSVIDYRLIKKSVKIPHSLWAVIRGLIMFYYTYVISINHIGHMPPILLINVFSVFYIFFELSLNKLRGLDWYYIGSTSDIDKFIRYKLKLKGDTLFGVKLLIFYLSFMIYDIFYGGN